MNRTPFRLQAVTALPNQSLHLVFEDGFETEVGLGDWIEHSRGLRALADPAPSSIGLGGAMFERLLAQDPGIDAVFFNNDDLAQGALLAALRLGLAVPGRVAVAGFNDLTGSDQMLPPLTTVRTPRAEIGSAAARMLLALMAGQPVARPCEDLGYELIVRGST